MANRAVAFLNRDAATAFRPACNRESGVGDTFRQLDSQFAALRTRTVLHIRLRHAVESSGHPPPVGGAGGVEIGATAR